MYLNNFLVIGIESSLVLSGLFFLVLGVFNKSKDINKIIYFATIFIMLLAAVMSGGSNYFEGSAFNDTFINDNFALKIKMLILLAVSLVLVVSYRRLTSNNLLVFEFPILVLCSTIGMLVMISSQDLIVLFVGLELHALPLYVLAAFNKKSLKSSEAGLKFFLLGALSSGLLLYGCSLIYGAVGSIYFYDISISSDDSNSWIILLGLGFILCGLSFKLSIVPFHMWAPDVYEGSPTPTTLFLASAPKLAVLAMTARILMIGFEKFTDGWQQILCILAILSIVFGSIAAIAQKNIKRLLAYSSISHMGFAIIGLVAGSQVGLTASLWYMVIYLVMTIGVFTFVLNMETKHVDSLNIQNISGLSKSSPNLAILMTFLICSMAGLPPFIGFFAKYFIFMAAIEAGFIWTVVLAVIGSVIGSFYYLRLIYYMYFGDTESTISIDMSRIEYLVFVFAGVFVLVGSLNFFGVDEYLRLAVESLFVND